MLGTEDHDRSHALKEIFSQSQAFLIDFGASNHMVSSKESFSSLDLSVGPSTHMGDDSQIPTARKGSIKLEHGVFKNVLYVPSLETNMLYVYQMTHNGSPKRVTFNHDTLEISEISTRNLIVKGFANHEASRHMNFLAFFLIHIQVP